MSILSAFTRSSDFCPIRIDEALPLHLETFRPPGEAPLIALLMEQCAGGNTFERLCGVTAQLFGNKQRERFRSGRYRWSETHSTKLWVSPISLTLTISPNFSVREVGKESENQENW